MAPQLTAQEVFETAVNIEKTGEDFYRKAATLAVDPSVSNLFLKLADMEHEHKSYFLFLKNDIASKEREAAYWSATQEISEYLRSLADKRVFPDTDPAGWMTGKESPADILRKAISIEKDSIIFYLTLRSAVSDKQGRERVDQIVQEELGHINILAKALSKAA